MAYLLYFTVDNCIKDLDRTMTAETALKPELTFLIIATGGFFIGKLFHKIKLPDVTGQILLGLMLGPSGAIILTKLLGREVHQIIPDDALHGLTILSQIALGIMTFTIGTHLTKRSLHNAGKRIMNLALWHTAITFLTVLLSLLFIAKSSFPVAILLAAIAISVAPGSVISVIQKRRARGVFTKTLLGIVAISNVTTIFMFDISRSISISLLQEGETITIGTILLSLLYPFLTVLWGIVVGLIATQVTKHMHDKKDVTAIISLIIIGNIAIAQQLGLSPLLVNLITGVVFSNYSYHIDDVRDFFGELEGILFSIFFTLAGTHLDLGVLKMAGVAGAVFVIARLIGQSLSAWSVCKINNYPPQLGKLLGLALTPKAGLSIGLLIVVTSSEVFQQAEGFVSIITAVILGAVVVNELIGPVAVSKTLDWTNESEQAMPRLIDFLHEEYIQMPLKGDDKWELIDHMCSFLIKQNHLKSISKEELHSLVKEREMEFPTAIGEGIAVPHARIPGNHKLMGVIGICEKPVEFGALDKKGVTIVILVATPEGKDTLHVKLLAAIARIFSNQEIRTQISNAGSAEEVYTILQSKEIRNINSYLEFESA